MEDWTAVRQKCTLNCLENNHNIPRHLLYITVKLSPLSQPALLPTSSPRLSQYYPIPSLAPCLTGVLLSHSCFIFCDCADTVVNSQGINMIPKSVRNKYKHWKMYLHPLIFVGICWLEIYENWDYWENGLKHKKDFMKFNLCSYLVTILIVYVM